MAVEFYDVHIPGEKLYSDLTGPVQVRKITPIEQKRLMTLLTNDDTTTKDVLKFINQLISGIDPNELYWPDYYYLLYHMRLITYKLFPLEKRCICPKCQAEQKVQIDITQLEEIPVPDFLTKDATITLDNFGEVPVRYKKVKDDVLVDDFIESHKLDASDFNIRVLLFDLCLLTPWKSLDELWELTESGEITTQDIVVLEDFYEKATWGVKEEVKHTCDGCHEEVANAFEMQLDSFFPSSFH